MRQTLLLLCLSFILQPGHVKRVVDGDTFVLFSVGVNGQEFVRILGIDTPERGQPLAAEATAFTKAWLAKGPSELVACKRDDFGRLLGGVTRGAESLSGALAEHGLANVMTR